MLWKWDIISLHTTALSGFSKMLVVEFNQKRLKNKGTCNSTYTQAFDHKIGPVFQYFSDEMCAVTSHTGVFSSMSGTYFTAWWISCSISMLAEKTVGTVNFWPAGRLTLLFLALLDLLGTGSAGFSSPLTSSVPVCNDCSWSDTSETPSCNKV